MRVDRIVVGGDVVPGPMAVESLEFLREIKIPIDFIRGNCEIAVLDQIAGVESPPLPERASEAIQWTAERLSPDQARALGRWPRTLDIDVPGLGRVLFCHATPRSETECFTRLTPEARLLPIFSEVGASLVVCGHTHMPFDRVIGDVRVVNAGSIGMPFGPPGASWLLLDGSDVRLPHTTYDLEDAARRVRATSYPEAQEFAANHILNPPAEAAMLEVFSRAEA